MTEQQVDLDALEALAKAADNWGGWAIWPDLTEGGFVHVGNEDGVIPEGQIATPDDAEPNPIAKAYTPEIAEFIAAADPATVLALVAELRQERERADEAEREVEEITTAWLDKDRQIAKAETALSRAEETIEAVRALAQQYIDQPGYGDYYFGLESAGEAVAAILTEYKQKGADRG